MKSLGKAPLALTANEYWLAALTSNASLALCHVLQPEHGIRAFHPSNQRPENRLAIVEGPRTQTKPPPQPHIGSWRSMTVIELEESSSLRRRIVVAEESEPAG
jgi:hypothetical protein